MCFIFACTFDVCHIQLNVWGVSMLTVRESVNSRRGTLHYGLISKWNACFAFFWYAHEFVNIKSLNCFEKCRFVIGYNSLVFVLLSLSMNIQVVTDAGWRLFFVCKNINVTPFCYATIHPYKYTLRTRWLTCIYCWFTVHLSSFQVCSFFSSLFAIHNKF